MELINISKVWDILEAGKMIYNMEKVKSFGKMVPFLKENFIKERKSMDNFHGPMDLYIQVNLIKIGYKEKGSLFIKMVDIIMESGRITLCTVMDNSNGWMVKFLKVIMWMTKRMGKGY